MRKAATISADGVYRYVLTRQWSALDSLSPALDLWIMLNPSKADADLDDPTIRRCITFSGKWGAAGIRVVNLFALRSTDPAALRTHPDPAGPENDTVLHMLTAHADQHGGRKIAAWGAHPMATERARKVMTILGPGVVALGRTRAGAPRHPLYVKGDTDLVHYRGPRA